MSIWGAFFSWSIAGVAATLVMDLLGAAARAAKVTHGVPPQLFGKWFQSLLSGRIFVDDIRTAPGEAAPFAVSMGIHYLIGIGFAVALGLGARMLGYRSVPWPVALLYGIATTAAAVFFMFPAMGFGMFGLKGPPEWRLLLTATINHFFYGVGLAVAARFIGAGHP